MKRNSHSFVALALFTLTLSSGCGSDEVNSNDIPPDKKEQSLDEINKLRDEIAKKWASPSNELKARSSHEVITGKEEINENDCHYIIEKTKTITKWDTANGQGSWVSTRELLNYTLGPDTKAKPDQCHQAANGPDLLGDLISQLQASVMLNLEKNQAALQNSGFTFKPVKLERDDILSIEAYRMDYEIEGTVTPNLANEIDAKKQGINVGDKMTGKWSFYLATNVVPKAYLVKSSLHGKIDGREYTHDEKNLLQVNNFIVP
jgi:hypothetical protein